MVKLDVVETTPDLGDSDHEKALALIGDSEKELAEFFAFIIERWIGHNEEAKKPDKKDLQSAIYKMMRTYYNGVDILSGYTSPD